MTLRAVDDGLRLLLRGERFDRPEGELRRLAAKLTAAVESARG